MIRFGKAMLLLTTGSIALTASTAAFAQDVAPSAASGGLADIVVTATRRSENLQKVPIAVAAFSAESLQTSRVEGVADLQLTTPGLTITNQGLGQTPFLRGVGSQDAAPGQELPIAIYIDGVYQPFPFANAIPFNNLERVEVLKGPQGTLFGRNATGGLIQFITKDPSEALGGSASVSYANYDTWTARAYLTGGIAEGVRADIAGYWTKQNKGYGKNLFTGKDVYTNNNFAVRSKWLIEPGDNTTITLIGDYRHEKSTFGYTYKLVPGSVAIDGSTTTDNFFDINTNVSPLYYNNAWTASGKIEQRFDNFTITSLTAYQDIKIHPASQDPDGTPSSIVQANFYNAISKMFSQELQVSSDGSGPFRWMVGLYYMHMRAGNGGPRGIQIWGNGVVPGDPATTPQGMGVNIVSTITTDSYAGFAEVGYDLTPTTHLTAGFRYSRDERRLKGNQHLELNPPGLHNGPLLSEFDEKTHFGSPSYRAILSQDVNDDVMLYASYSRGFKSGNYNATNPANAPYKPEDLYAYEVGMKGRFLDRKLQLNAAAFYYDYKNLQVVENTGPTTEVHNAAKSRVKGFEIDALAMPSPNFTFRAGFTYLDAKYTEFTNASCYFPAPGGLGNVAAACDVGGNPLVRTPKYAVNLGGDYTLPTNIGDFTLSGSFYANSGVNFTTTGRLKQKAYEVMNGNLSWTDPTDRYQISVFGKNLFDVRYTAYQVEQGTSDIQVGAPPRTYGVEFALKF